MNEPEIREAETKDWPAICRLHREIEERMGQKMDLPPLTVTRDDKEIRNPALLGFWVVEIAGEAVEFFYIEKGLELCFGGRDPRATLKVQGFQEELIRRMSASGARVLHCHVPDEFPDVCKHLEDSHFNQTGYKHFTLGLVPR